MLRPSRCSAAAPICFCLNQCERRHGRSCIPRCQNTAVDDAEAFFCWNRLDLLLRPGDSEPCFLLERNQHFFFLLRPMTNWSCDGGATSGYRDDACYELAGGCHDRGHLSNELAGGCCYHGGGNILLQPTFIKGVAGGLRRWRCNPRGREEGWCCRPSPNRHTHGGRDRDASGGTRRGGFWPC